ncbi:unnamed protein product [Lathyrus oleraceus]
MAREECGVLTCNVHSVATRMHYLGLELN